MKKREVTGEDILKGIQKAVHEMLVKTAAIDGEVVISDENGNPIRVKAKEILKEREKKKKNGS